MEEKEMTFWAHLEDLRKALFRVVAVLLVCMIACFCVMPDLFDTFVLGPTTSDFFLYRWLSGLGGTGLFLPDFSDDAFAVEIININVASQFLTHISTSFWFALVLMFPYLTFEVWRSSSRRCSRTSGAAWGWPSPEERSCSSWGVPWVTAWSFPSRSVS